MPKSMVDPIAAILSEYARDPARNEKKAVLLTPQGGYFLYGNRFCSILNYELEFQCDSCQIQGNTTQNPLFLGKLQDGFHAIGEKLYKPDLVSLIFHIDIGEGELLHGILFALEQEVRFALFCDAAVEELYRLTRKAGGSRQFQVLPDKELRQCAENLRRNDLHGLTGLYMRGRPIASSVVGNC